MRRVLIIGGGVFVGIMAAIIAIILFLIPRATDWTYERTVDAMTDKPSATATISNRENQEFQLECTDGGPVRLALAPGEQMDGYLEKTQFAARMVKFRFDGGRTRETVGFVFKRMIGFEDEGKNWAAPIIAGLPRAKTIAIEATSYDGGAVQMVFDVSGAEEAIAELKSNCGKR